jgi:Bacterial SH3 domain
MTRYLSVWITRWLAGAGLALLMLAPLAGLAQGDGCPLLVQQALEAAGDNCNALDRNSVCYGFNRVSATFVEAIADTFFTQPADRAALQQVSSLTTAPLDVPNEDWGIAVMNVQANLPGTLPGQAVTLMLIGDAAVENAVAPEDAVISGDPVGVTVLVGANVRSGPTISANVLTSVPAGTELPADAVDASGDWVRVVADGVPGWLATETLDEAADLGSLPVITAQSRSPMQAFTLRTGLGRTDCIEAPPSLAVLQGPRSIQVQLTVNGADIALGSTIILRLLEGNILELVVLDGKALLDGISVPAGFKTTVPLGPDGQVVGSWSLPVPLSAEELALFVGLELIPGNLLHYPIELPTQEDILQTFIAISGGNTSGNGGPAGNPAVCAGLRPTSPLGGMAFGAESFFWDGIAAASAYRVNIYNELGLLVASYETAAPATSLVGDTSAAVAGYSAAWEVVALIAGQEACTSARVSMNRASPPGPEAPPEPETTPEPICNFNTICEAGLGETYFNCADCS